MGLHVPGIGIVAVVGGYQRNIQLPAHAKQRLIDRLLLRNAVILQLQEIISFSENCFIL